MVRIVFLVEALGLIVTILEEVIKGFNLLTGAFFAMKFLAKMVLALATDGTSLILGSIALLLTDTSNIIVKARAVSDQCHPSTAPIAAPLTGGAPASPQSPPIFYAVAVDSHGTLYVPDYANTRIQTWAPNATAGVTIIQGNLGGGAPWPGDPAAASALAVAADGTVYTINNTYHTQMPGSVYKWVPGASTSTPVIIGTGLQQPQGIALGPGGTPTSWTVTPVWCGSTRRVPRQRGCHGRRRGRRSRRGGEPVRRRHRDRGRQIRQSLHL